MSNQVQPYSQPEDDDIFNLAITTPIDSEPVSFAQIREEMGIFGTPVETKALVDRTFTIKHAKPFHSSFKEGEHAWYCTVQPSDSTPLLSVVLGGGACVEFLDAYARAGIKRPLTVTLRYAEGAGRFAGYYFFE